MSFKPMLSATCESVDQIRFPVLVSPKLDGIRCIITEIDGVATAVSRNLKPIPNAFIQSKLRNLPIGIDGELIVGSPVGDDVWNRSNSGVMSREGEPEFTFWVFDHMADCEVGFTSRLALARDETHRNMFVKIVPHTLIRNADEFARIESKYVEMGYEGVMVRAPDGLYKFGRSTVREGGLMKVKRWHDAEAKIIDFVERQHNTNEATKDALGRTKRSSAKAGKTGRGDLGALVCAFGGVVFELGTGFDDQERRRIWCNRSGFIGKIVTFKYQALTPDGIPRFPVFKCFKHAHELEAV